MTKRSVFANVRFDMFFASILEHSASQERSMTSRRPYKTAPGSLQKPLKKITDFWTPFEPANNQKIDPKVVRKLSRNGSKKSSRK
jgi:hypothetical protein